MTPKSYGFYRCRLCEEWFEASLCQQVGRYDVCGSCLAYLHETIDSDHPISEWDVDRALGAAARDASRAGETT